MLTGVQWYQICPTLVHVCHKGLKKLRQFHGVELSARWNVSSPYSVQAQTWLDTQSNLRLLMYMLCGVQWYQICPTLVHVGHQGLKTLRQFHWVELSARWNVSFPYSVPAQTWLDTLSNFRLLMYILGGVKWYQICPTWVHVGHQGLKKLWQFHGVELSARWNVSFPYSVQSQIWLDIQSNFRLWMYMLGGVQWYHICPKLVHVGHQR